MKKEKRRKTYQFQSHFPKFFGCTFRICWPHRQIHHFLFIGSIKSSRNFQSIGTSSSPNSAYSLILDHFEVLTPSTVLNSAKSQKNKANHPKGTPESNSSRNFAVERPIQMKNDNIFVKKTTPPFFVRTFLRTLGIGFFVIIPIECCSYSYRMLRGRNIRQTTTTKGFL